MSDKIKVLGAASEFATVTGAGTVLVDFFATWCGPCRMQLAILNEVADKVSKDVNIIKIDTEQFSEIASQYQVSSIPTLIVFKNGEVVERFTGLQQENTLVETLEKYA